MYLDFLVLPGAPNDVIICSPALENLRARIDTYEQCIKLSHKGKTETINFEYERTSKRDSEDELTSCSESDSTDSREESDEEFVLTLSDAYSESPQMKQCKARLD